MREIDLNVLAEIDENKITLNEFRHRHGTKMSVDNGALNNTDGALRFLISAGYVAKTSDDQPLSLTQKGREALYAESAIIKRFNITILLSALSLLVSILVLFK